MVHSLRLFVTKRDAQVERGVADAFWHREVLPTREAFFEAVEAAYDLIELPWFPSRAWIEVERHDLIETIECDRPVDEPGMVALALWACVPNLELGA